MGPNDAFEIRDEVQLVDVREPSEWTVGHIEGAVHIPMGELNHRQDELAKDRTIVAVCRSGNRSGQLTALLAPRGLDIVNMVGGMNAWLAAGLPVVRDDGAPGSVL